MQYIIIKKDGMLHSHDGRFLWNKQTLRGEVADLLMAGDREFEIYELRQETASIMAEFLP